MPRLTLTLAYQGTRYAGWQLQAKPDGCGPPTIQGTLESCVARITGKRFAIHGAGRTDSGVHAEAQVCHLDLPEGAERIDWRQALNTRLPHDIRVTGAAWAADGFHSRKSALRKRYAYSLWMDRDRALPRIASFVWSIPRIDLERIGPVLPLLTGQRDFASFQNSGTPITDTVRTLRSIHVLPGMVASLACPREWPVATLVFEGDGFLKQMVRNLVGLLIWVAQGKTEAVNIPAIFAAANRRALPAPSAPARGLTLLEVLY